MRVIPYHWEKWEIDGDKETKGNHIFSCQNKSSFVLDLLQHVLAFVPSKIVLHSILECSPDNQLNCRKIYCLSKHLLSDIRYKWICTIWWTKTDKECQGDEYKFGWCLAVTLHQERFQFQGVLGGQKVTVKCCVTIVYAIVDIEFRFPLENHSAFAHLYVHDMRSMYKTRVDHQVAMTPTLNTLNSTQGNYNVLY